MPIQFSKMLFKTTFSLQVPKKVVWQFCVCWYYTILSFEISMVCEVLQLILNIFFFCLWPQQWKKIISSKTIIIFPVWYCNFMSFSRIFSSPYFVGRRKPLKSHNVTSLISSFISKGYFYVIEVNYIHQTNNEFL